MESPTRVQLTKCRSAYTDIIIFCVFFYFFFLRTGRNITLKAGHFDPDGEGLKYKKYHTVKFYCEYGLRISEKLYIKLFYDINEYIFLDL